MKIRTKEKAKEKSVYIRKVFNPMHSKKIMVEITSLANANDLPCRWPGRKLVLVSSGKQNMTKHKKLLDLNSSAEKSCVTTT